MNRKFEITDARRVQVPLLIGVAGPSFSGKTYSALRLATGIAKVNQGPIVYIDTEGRRALHYADEFKFRHIPFTEPYGSLDYVAAIDAALESKPAVIVVDSASHEHEGTGGYLDLANQEIEAGKKEGQHWAKPSVCRRRLLSRIQTLPCSAIFCFRAKEALDWKQVFAKKAKAPPPMGETIVGTADFSFEMTVRFLVHAGSNGKPTWHSELAGEKAAIKLPKQFEPLFRGDPRQITESDGEAMARWAAGEAPAQPTKADARPPLSPRCSELLKMMGSSKDDDELTSIEADMATEEFSEHEDRLLGAALKKRRGQLAA